MKSLVLFLLINANLVLAAPIEISEISQIDFGSGAPSDPAKTVPAGTSENSTNGSFQITGDANAAFTITLPTTATLSTDNGGVQDTIAISSFTSYPATTSTLDASGSRSLFLGATRAALKSNQKAGSYTGSYSVTVVY